MRQPMPMAAKRIVSTRVRNRAWKCIISTLRGIVGFSSKAGGEGVGGADRAAETEETTEEPGRLSDGTRREAEALSPGNGVPPAVTMAGGTPAPPRGAVLRRAHGCKALATAPGV